MGSQQSRRSQIEDASPALLESDVQPLTAGSSRPNPEHGLTTREVEQRRAQFGFNEVSSKKTHPLVKLLKNFWGPMPWLIELAAVVSGALQDWKDFAFLLALLIINGLVAFFEEFKAGNAIDALKKSLAPTARVLRDGSWIVIEARELVPDDTVLLRLGDVVPADAILQAGESMEVDQAALTGESLPVTKFEGELVYQGSVIKRGELTAVVSAIGKDSFFGKAASLVDSVDRPGNFQRVLFNMAKILVALALVVRRSVGGSDSLTSRPAPTRPLLASRSLIRSARARPPACRRSSSRSSSSCSSSPTRTTSPARSSCASCYSSRPSRSPCRSCAPPRWRSARARSPPRTPSSRASRRSKCARAAPHLAPPPDARPMRLPPAFRPPSRSWRA